MSKRVRSRTSKVLRTATTSKSSHKTAGRVDRSGDVPRPIRKATTKFIKQYRSTLRDLENF